MQILQLLIDLIPSLIIMYFVIKSTLLFEKLFDEYHKAKKAREKEKMKYKPLF